MAWMMSRMATSSPPGVSISSTINCALCFCACAMPRVTKLALAGPMAPLIGMT